MTTRGQCLNEETALAFLEGEIPPERRAAAEGHIEVCGACRQLLGAMVHLNAGRRSDSPVSSPPAPPASSSAASPAAPAVPASPASPDRYTVLGEHARGGQARILLAFDENLGRVVALKELLPFTGNPADDSSWRDATARFLREAELTGQLAHPGVVPVFEVGRRPDGTLFYTMQLVRGRTLSEVLRERRSLPDRLALLSHFLSICHVVAYAHSRGVLHRDIKPQNIMVGEFGETVLLDWGLAKQRGETDGALMTAPWAGTEAPEAATRSGTAMGTPGYMSPEQAIGKVEEVDECSDTYGLGAVLFEILTGRPPPGQSLPDGAAMPRVRALCAKAPPELAAVAEKAIAPKKENRYQLASELAQDVTSFMTGGRVAAYAYTSRELLKRFATRHRLLLGAATVTFAAILSGLILAAAAWRSELASRRAAAARGHEALQQGAKLALAVGDKLQARAKIRGALELSDSLTLRALWGRLRSDPERFAIDFPCGAQAVSFAPDGRELAVGLQSGIVELVDPVTRATRILRGSGEQIFGISYSPDGSLLAARPVLGPVSLWDLKRGARIELGEHGLVHRGLAFSPDGALLATADSGKVLLWDTHSGDKWAELPSGRVRLRGIAFSPQGRLATSIQDGKVLLWDLQTRTPLLAIPGFVETLDFSPDGALLVGGGLDGNITLWSAPTGEVIRVLRGLGAEVAAVVVSPDGRRLASAFADGTVRLWSLPEGDLMRVLKTGKSVAVDVTFSSDGSLLAAASGLSTWVWDLRVPGEPATPTLLSSGLNEARFSPDGARIVSVAEDGAVRQWDAASGELLAAWTGHATGARNLCFTPNGKLLATVGQDGLLMIRDAETGALRYRLPGGDRLWAVACAPDSRHVASGGFDAKVRLWDALSGELVRTLAGPPPLDFVTSLVFSADGSHLVAGRQFGRIEIWDAASGRLARVLTGHSAGVMGLAFDPQGGLLASAGFDRSVHLWNLTDGTSRMRREATGRIFRIGWDRPSGRLAAASSTGEILVWSDGDARPVTFKAHRADANSIDFSPDGNKAVSAGDDGVLRLWDTATWRPKWLTRAVIRGARPEILTHTGWHALDSQRRLVSKTPPSSAWRRAVEIAQDAAAQPGGPVCVAAESGLEIWDMESDTRAATENIAAPFEVAAVAGGCSVLKDGRATLYRQGHPPVELAHEVAVQSGGELLTLVGSEVTLFDPRQARIPRSLGTFGVGLGVTAAAPLGKALAVGFRDGNIELRQQGERVPISFQDTPASEVTRLEAGPKGLLAAGFADGSFGVWSSDSGERLERGAVHGAVRHLALDGDFLIVASEVGAVTSMDLSVFTADYCELLREVWSDVPVLWNDQAAVLASPEPASPCRLPSR